MHIIDLTIFVVYLIGMLAIGYYFLNRNKSADDYFVSGRNMKAWHVGLSVVATDVGGGFSIGLGGLGFAIGISGSWMLFTGLLGAWLSAVILIPRINALGHKRKLLTFPQLFEYFYDPKTALLAGIISAIGYIGFTSSQILAGAKLASASIDGISLNQALIIMGATAIVYTVLGGMKAVIYTDTIQWGILLAGLIFIGIPVAYHEVGGMESIKATLSPEFLSLTNIHWYDMVNWMVTIVPIWFVGMTLYQRIYACKDVKEAKKAWFIAGLFEWPIMAFMGVTLGILGRVAAEQGLFQVWGIDHPTGIDAEMGLPILLKTVLPVGLLGLMMSAYFSAIMSTADSCLMAASGNIVTDILQKLTKRYDETKKALRASQWITLIVGSFALLLATVMTNVLELMLYSYAFMVSGLFVPIVWSLFGRRRSSKAAFWSMLLGGFTTIALIVSQKNVFGYVLPETIDENCYGITLSFIAYWSILQLDRKNSIINTKNDDE